MSTWATVYTGPKRQHEINGVPVTLDEVEVGATRITCLDCFGTGTYEGCPAGPEPCVPCKGTGLVWVQA